MVTSDMIALFAAFARLLPRRSGSLRSGRLNENRMLVADEVGQHDENHAAEVAQAHGKLISEA